MLKISNKRTQVLS
uniref:Uncharacterized protein n=1 Tax=Anguilla anguilla TaxID=7936 RepID=A0A0E9QBF2_ANGAN